MIYLHYNLDDGAIIKAYHESCFRENPVLKKKNKDYKPKMPPTPHIIVEDSAWKQAHKKGSVGVVIDGQLAIKENYTYADYQIAMENHIKETRCARGYTTREPDVYKDCGVERWRQDALDFIAFRDEVMLYGLDVLNAYTAKKPVPSLEDFKKGLPKIKWTIE